MRDRFAFYAPGGNRTHEKSDAVLIIIGQMPFPWNTLRIFKFVPVVFRDWVYDRIARNRYKLFGKSAICVAPQPEHKNRFL